MYKSPCNIFGCTVDFLTPCSPEKMKTKFLHQYIEAQLDAPSTNFDFKVADLYYHVIDKYDRKFQSMNPEIIQRLSERLQKLLILLMTFPPAARELMILSTYFEMRITASTKLLNTLTRLYTLAPMDINTVVEKLFHCFGDEFELVWPTLAKSYANTQPLLFEKLLYEGIIATTDRILSIYDYGALMLCICYYRSLVINKNLRDEIKSYLPNIVPPRGIVGYLASFVRDHDFCCLTDENMPWNVYEICGLHPFMHGLSSRFGVVSTPLLAYPLAASAPSNRQYNPPHANPTDPVPSTSSQPDSPPTYDQAIIPAIVQRDPLLSIFNPPQAYRDVKTFVYQFGSRILYADEMFLQQLSDKISEFSQRLPLLNRNKYVHNFMAIYTQIIGLIRQHTTVNPILGKVVRITSYSRFRADIDVTYMNDAKICEKLKVKRFVGIYVNGQSYPSILCEVYRKGQYTEQGKRNRTTILYRKVILRCMLPVDCPLQANDAIGLTETIDLSALLYEANCLARTLEGRPHKRP